GQPRHLDWFGERAAIDEARRKADAVDQILAARVQLDHTRRRQVGPERDLRQVRSVISGRDVDHSSGWNRGLDLSFELADRAVETSRIGGIRVVVTEQRGIGGYRADESDRPAILEGSIERQHLTQKLRIDRAAECYKEGSIAGRR